MTPLPSDPSRSAYQPDWQFATAHHERLYAIGDVHGNLQMLRRILEHIDNDLEKRPIDQFRIIFLGDLVDRGDDSKGVVDLVMDMSGSPHVIVLSGNHEDMALSAWDSPEALLSWRQYGGLETLVSFGVSPLGLMRGQDIQKTWDKFRTNFGPDRQIFFKTLASSYQSGDYFFCHAGIRPGIPFSDQSRQDLLWIRDDFLGSEREHGKIIVHGHTPVPELEIRNNRINVDTGAYLTGKLSCLVLEGSNVSYFSTQHDRITRIF